MEIFDIRDMTGMIHRIRYISLGWMLLRLGSFSVAAAIISCMTARNTGSPITAKGFCIQSFGSPFIPK